MRYREQKEEWELRELAPYAMKSRESRGRRYAEEPDRFRTIYQRDRDRVIHSTAFRRLEYKTQVFVNHEGDYYRTRLTHTLEVSQIARSVASALNLNQDLVEALSLAHDLGHTPFGHSGGDALHEMMKDHGGFEHNIQGLRIVDELEQKYPAFPGLNLSYELRESILKHPGAAERQGIQGFDASEAPLLEAQIVDVADSIAYNNHDTDDGVTSGILSPDDLAHVTLWREASEALSRRHGDLPQGVRMLQTVNTMIKLAINDLIEASHGRIRDHRIRSVEDVRRSKERLIAFSEPMEQRQAEMHRFLLAHLYRHHRVHRIAEKARRFVKDMFRAYVESPEMLPPFHRARAEKIGVHRAVADYIAGLTDREAQDEYRKLFAPYERM